MEVIRDLDACPAPGVGSVVAIGNFDGFHLGHRAVAASVIERAGALGAKSAIVTFDRHPMEWLKPEEAPCRLTTLDKKLALMAEAGIDYACVLTFDEQLSGQEPERFVEDVISKCLRAKAVVVGENFRFGHNRRGDLAMLGAIGEELGFEADSLDLIKAGSVAISSTRIRHAIREGEIAWGSMALGRDHSIQGVVQAGDRRGRDLGFPTANLMPDPRICIPADGVYAGWVRIDDVSYGAAINVGKRPTFGKDLQMLIEAHILDFEGDIYGQEIEVGFHAHVRGEYRFSGPEELAEQIKQDVLEARRLMEVD
ncbi:MAG: bifunctional riboflavin kinase/FAD synthetase [Acidobacteria bacterium]|nr:MAG: bifunctional riboflavin kinase/FAD synthetase [Acidobacteriota bacterium]